MNTSLSLCGTGALLLALLVSPRVQAAGSASDDQRAEVAGAHAPTLMAKVEPSPDRKPWLGLVLDAGVPDGAQVGLVVRPWSWLRIHAGGGYNLASGGIRGGATYVPFDYWVVPTLTLEGGYFFAGNPQGAVEAIAGVDVEYVPERIAYGYANAHLGLEFGGDWFTFFLRGGYSYIDATVRPPDTEEDLRFEEDARLVAWAPSAKLGFIVYMY